MQYAVEISEFVRFMGFMIAFLFLATAVVFRRRFDVKIPVIVGVVGLLIGGGAWAAIAGNTPDNVPTWTFSRNKGLDEQLAAQQVVMPKSLESVSCGPNNTVNAEGKSIFGFRCNVKPAGTNKPFEWKLQAQISEDGLPVSYSAIAALNFSATHNDDGSVKVLVYVRWKNAVSTKDAANAIKQILAQVPQSAGSTSADSTALKTEESPASVAERRANEASWAN
jgi:hypothetical protein